MTRILIVDDHPIILEGLRRRINDENDLTVCGEAQDAATALEIIKKKPPGLLVTDISMKGMSGLDLIKSVRVRGLQFPIIVLSIHDEATYAERALKAGAQGYLLYFYLKLYGAPKLELYG